MKRKICLSLWSLEDLTFRYGKTLFDLLEISADLGVDGVDIGEDYHRWPPYDTVHGLNLIRKKAHSLGLQILSTWIYTDFVAAVATSSVDEVVAQISDMLAKCNLLECPFVALPPGDAWQGVDPEKGHQVFLEVFGRLVDVAKEYGVRMALEVGRPAGIFQKPEYALRLVEELGSPYLTIAPDFEAWRFETEDLPLCHVEAPGSVTPAPSSLEVFRRCMPYSPLIHAKMLGFDANGNEPHMPIPEMMEIIKESPIPYIIDIEYEGWIPDIRPDVDSVAASANAIALLQRYLG